MEPHADIAEQMHMPSNLTAAPVSLPFDRSSIGFLMSKPVYAYAGVRVPKKLAEVVKVIDLPRANNVSIMLTQFTSFKGGALQLRHAVLTGAKLGLERVSLLLQVSITLCLLSVIMIQCECTVTGTHPWMSASAPL